MIDGSVLDGTRDGRSDGIIDGFEEGTTLDGRSDESKPEGASDLGRAPPADAACNPFEMIGLLEGCIEGENVGDTVDVGPDAFVVVS